MTRRHIDYTARHRTGAAYTGFDADTPTDGFYRTRLVSGGVYVGVRIWFGAPLDPIDGSELDRAPRWNAMANGKPIDLARVWPGCARDPINASEYAYLVSTQAWGEQNAPDSPQADPTRRVDPNTSPILF